jgi:hypothetical protein
VIDENESHPAKQYEPRTSTLLGTKIDGSDD